jgi:ABC-type spermidine/putrescine transport system permease subunit I
MVYDFLPFMILPIYNVLMKIEKDTIDAARDLGAGYFTTLRKIILPSVFPESSAESSWFSFLSDNFCYFRILGGRNICSLEMLLKDSSCRPITGI